MTTHLKTSAGALALCLPLLALAQPQAGDASGSPESQHLSYQSAFADYTPWVDIKPADWRTVNDTVGGTAPAAGGHVGHGAATAPAAPPTAGSAAPVHPRSDGHRSHGGAK